MSFFSTKFHVCKVLSVSTVLSLFTYMYLYVSRHVVMYFLFFFLHFNIYIFKQLCDIIALLLFFLCAFFFVFSSRTDRFFNLSCYLFSYPLSLKQTSSFTKIIFFFGFSQKIKRGKKSFVPSLSLQVKTNFGLRL